MAATRVFYVIQGSLQVRDSGGDGVADALNFPDSDEGFRRFDEYLASSPATASLIVVDVIEEVFATDTVPKLRRRDTLALLERRARRKYPRTPYRLSAKGAKSAKHEHSAVFSAIANRELLDPWVGAIVRSQVPLLGIFSVPHLAPLLARKFCHKSSPLLFVTQHQGNSLRQSFIKDGLVQSARLSKSPRIDDAAYPQFVNTEILRSRRYLERTRLIGVMDELHVCMIADKAMADEIVRLADGSSPTQFKFLDNTTARKRMRLPSDSPSDHHESIYIAAALKNPPKFNYAGFREQRYWHMHRLRHAIIGAAVATAVVCSVFTGAYFGDAWRLRSEAATVDAQIAQLSETFRRENESFGPIKADSYEMKLAVDTGDYILRQRVPVPWVLQQLGLALQDYDDIRITEVAWQTESNAAAEPPRARPGEAPQPVPIPAVNAVSADILASIEPFDGDLRAAFGRIDQLVEEIRVRTAFSDVYAVDYPVDASPNSSLSGDLGEGSHSSAAQFRLRLRFPLAPDAVSDGGTIDESI